MRAISGEAASIRQMIAKMVADHGISPRRIFITGLSAGGAMTSVMLATYPEVFAAGAVIAGLPFGVAGNVREALSGMMQSQPRPARELGDLVRDASDHRGPWPKLSVWHGSADRTVHPDNAGEIVKQWLDLHGLDEAPMSEATVDGYPRQVWWNDNGETVIESYTITDMAHGTPLGLAGNDERYGAEGAFLIEAGISSSYHIANFFGLTRRLRSQSRCQGSHGCGGKGTRKAVPARSAGDAERSRSRHHAVAERDAGTTRRAGAKAAPPRHRCRRSHHPRAGGGGVDEVITSCRAKARSASSR